MPRFATALCLFLLFSFCVGICRLPVGRYSYPVHSWAWWTVNAFGKLDYAPDTVLLGSSLMVVANTESDALQYGQKVDLATYRSAKVFDDCLSTALGRRVRSLNLASPGQLPSDAYLMLRTAMDHRIRPRLVIYGIAPRDLLCGQKESAFDTDCYRYLSKLVDTSCIDDALQFDVYGSLKRNLVKANPLLRRAQDTQVAVCEGFSRMTGSLLDRSNGSSSIALNDRMMLLADYEPLDMVPGFISSEGKPLPYKDNLDEYSLRYRNPHPGFYSAQVECLGRLAALCRSNDIELVLCNMPVRKENIDLIDRAHRERYLRDIRSIACDRFLDMCEFDSYKQADYKDSVHLNGSGGRKFLEKLTSSLARR